MYDKAFTIICAFITSLFQSFHISEKREVLGSGWEEKTVVLHVLNKMAINGRSALGLSQGHRET